MAETLAEQLTRLAADLKAATARAAEVKQLRAQDGRTLGKAAQEGLRVLRDDLTASLDSLDALLPGEEPQEPEDEDEAELYEVVPVEITYPLGSEPWRIAALQRYKLYSD